MKKNPFAVILAAFLAAVSFSCATYAEDESEGGGHLYLGGSTGYFKPDTDRMGGNTRTAGAQVGYQFNDRWSAELGYQMDAFGPGSDDLKMYDLEFIRHWGDEVRFLIEFGYTHVSLDAGGPDDSTAGFHIGTGLSAFVTDALELRGDIKLIQTKNEGLLDGMGTLSLNYHFGRTRAAQEAYEEPVLGSSSEPAEESLAPIEYREPIEAEEPVVQEPIVQEPVAAEPAVAPVAEVPPAPAVVAEEPAIAPAPAAAVAVPTSVHTLVNFGSDSLDVGSQYGQQLDQISSQIINTNSRAVVEGHTDNQGAPAYNKVLSADRAIVVKRELKNRGVKGEDVSIVGYGEERPVATNETAEGREQNRRVEVKVYDKQ